MREMMEFGREGESVSMRPVSPPTSAQRWTVLLGLALTLASFWSSCADPGPSAAGQSSPLLEESHVSLVVDGQGVVEAENPSSSTVGAGEHVWSAVVGYFRPDRRKYAVAEMIEKYIDTY